MAFDNPILFCTNVEIVTNAQQPLFRVPSGHGGITIVDATVMFYSAGTAGLHLINGGSVGTSTGADGTLASKSSAAYTAKTPQAMTVSATPYIGAGSYVCLKEDNSGTTVDITQVAICYKWGK